MRPLLAGRGAPRLVGLILGAALATLGLSGTAFASHAAPGTKAWGYEAAVGSARILQYDIGTDTLDTTCVPPGSNNGRGIEQDASGNLFYTFVSSDGLFNGDGLIHHTTLPPACLPLPAIPFGDGPGGTVEDEIGAMDVDPDTGDIWAAGYKPDGSNNIRFYRVNPLTGAIISQCKFPFQGGGVGNDTLAVTKSLSLGGSGKYLLTDGGELLTTLFVFDAADCTGDATPVPLTTYSLPEGVTGTDFVSEGGTLIASTISTIDSLGGPPFGSVVASMSSQSAVEDLTLKAPQVSGGHPPKCRPPHRHHGCRR